MKYALKSVPSLPYVGVPHDRDGPRTLSRCMEQSGEARKKFQMTNLTMPNTNSVSSMNYALK